VDDRLEEFLQSDLIKKIHKSMKREVVQLASERKQDSPARIPTGVFNVDYALGGGWPVGRVSLVWGPKASFKTSMFLKSIANAQKMCANCWIPHNPLTGEIMCACGEYRPPIIGFMDVEGAMDFSWARALGVDTEKLLYSIPDHGEEALDVMDALVRSGEVDIFALDSLAFLIPIKEVEESNEKGMMGDQPRMIGRAIRKLIGALNSVGNDFDRRPTIFLVNQIRQKLTMFGDPTTQPGGFAPGFIASVEMRTFSGKYPDTSTGHIPNHVDLSFRIEKNKVGPTKIEGDFRLILMDSEVKRKGEVQDEPQILNLLEISGLLDRSGNKWSCFDRVFRSKSLVERAITIEPEYGQLVRTQLMERLLKSYFTGVPLNPDSEEIPSAKGSKGSKGSKGGKSKVAESEQK